jgi:hypothetical protein
MEQRPQGSKGKPSGPPEGTVVLDKVRAAIVQLSLIIDAVCIGLLAWLSTGDEVTCGAGISQQTCYLPGVEWLGYVMVAATCMTVVSMMMLSPKK